MPPQHSSAEVKERLKKLNKMIKDLMDRTDDGDPKYWTDAAKILAELHEAKMAMMAYFPEIYGVSFRRWYRFFSEFDKRIDEGLAGAAKEDHSEDYVSADLDVLLMEMEKLKKKVERDLKVFY
jgi:hypothetical protein